MQLKLIFQCVTKSSDLMEVKVIKFSSQERSGRFNDSCRLSVESKSDLSLSKACRGPTRIYVCCFSLYKSVESLFWFQFESSQPNNLFVQMIRAKYFKGKSSIS